MEAEKALEENIRKLNNQQNDISKKFNELIKLIDMIIESGKNAQLFLTLKNHEYLAQPENPNCSNFIDSLYLKILEIQKYKIQQNKYLEEIK